MANSLATDWAGNARSMILVASAITLVALGYLHFVAYDDGRIFRHLLVRHDPAGAIALLLIFLLLALSSGIALDYRRLADAIARHHVPIAGALWLLLSVGSLHVYRNQPLSMDEYAAVFQAATFAEGHLLGRVPAEMMDWVIPKGFQGHFFVVNGATGELASGYWPGFSILLTPFVKLGIPWACNPLIVACSTWVIGNIARQVTGDEASRGWAILLALASPAFTLNGIAFYSMPAHLLFNLLFVWLLLDPQPRRVFLAGLVGSFALVLHNPFPHLLFALPWLAWLVVRRKGGVRNALILAAGYSPLILLLGVGWVWTLDSLRSSVPLPGPLLASGSDWPWLIKILIGLTRPFSLPGETTLAYRMEGLLKLWLWSAPFLLLLAIAAANRASTLVQRLMGLSLLVTILGYFFVPVSQGHGWGDRYAHSAWGVLPILAAGWISQLPLRNAGYARLFPAIAKAALLSLAFAICLRGWQIGEFMNQHLAQLPPYPAGRPAIVFVGGGYYAKDLVQNDPWLRRQPWILSSQGAQKDAALAERMLPGGCTYSSSRNGWTYAACDFPQ